MTSYMLSMIKEQPQENLQPEFVYEPTKDADPADWHNHCTTWEDITVVYT